MSNRNALGQFTNERRPIAERLREKIDSTTTPDGCHPFIGSRTRKGYGLIATGGRNEPRIYTHRATYELYVGSIPRGLFVLHTCDNPSCCRVDHLFLGTATDNVRDMFGKGRSSIQQRPEAYPRGSRHHSAKLKEADIPEIRALAKKGITQTEIGRRYGVLKSTIRQIVIGKAWTHV